MPEQNVTIINKLGLHARAAAKFVQVASHYTAEITLKKDSKEVNGKSIMGVMMLAAGQGTKLTLVTEGEEAEEAMQALTDLINDYFGEGE